MSWWWKAARAAWLGLCLIAAPQAAQARWLKAETERFAVYSDGGEAELRTFATKLATFDRILRFRHGVDERSSERKLAVYLVRGPQQLQRIAPRIGYGVYGFYRATPRGIVAVAIRDDRGFGADDVLFHEYTHHFMLEYFPVAYPAWLIEGYAEYFSTMQVTPEGVEIGRYNNLRAGLLKQVNWIFLGDLLTRPPSDFRGEKIDAYYGQSWLLTHYMMMDDTRVRQLDTAVRAMAEGKPAVAALEAATGKRVGVLNEELRQYFRGKLLYRRMKNPLFDEAPMTVVELPPSADQFLLEWVSLSGPMTNNDGRALLRTVSSRAKGFQDDQLADLTTARAELRFGDLDDAEAILARRLKNHPKEAESLWLMGEVQLARGDRDKSRQAEFYKAARPYLAQAFAADGSDFRVLYSYARSRSLEAGYPDENTLNSILLALQLAPSVDALRLAAGEGLLERAQKAEAIAVLTPLANSPHSAARRARAAALIAAAKGQLTRPEASELPNGDEAEVD